METLQTAEPLKRMNLETWDRAISWVASSLSPGSPDAFDLNQPYQRGLVWSVRRKRLLIQSLIEGIPVPALIINDRFSGRFSHPGYSRDRCWMHAVIDGKQRVSAIAGFLLGKFAIPASWPEESWIAETVSTGDGKYVYHDGLTLPAQRFLSNVTITVKVGKFASMADEERIFNRVNFGGVAQGDSDFA